MKNIILTGFMGSGKSTIGKCIEQKIPFEFIDTDSFIEKKYNMSINEIFEKHNEEFFREIETNAIKELCQNEGKVLATGGGVVTRQENIKVMKQNGIIIFINVPFNSIRLRLENDNTRPLINTPEKFDNMERIYLSRLPIYISSADIVVNGDDSAQICEEIIEKLKF